jgi:CBS domain-containing protein
MWEHDCGILPIVDETGKVTAVITDRDICIALSTRAGSPWQIGAGEVAQAHLFVCEPDQDVNSALKTMSEERVHRLPVVNKDGNLVGILSINDVILRADKGDTRKPGIPYDDVIRALQAICAHPHHTVAA